MRRNNEQIELDNFKPDYFDATPDTVSSDSVTSSTDTSSSCIRTQVSTDVARPHQADASHHSPLLSQWVRKLLLVFLRLL
uniref:Uncharacterized protein n=1 Tax=Timema monikensis TaxID=170555 RepID=A0A7R9E3Q6_9NEOP|nr:unnamed protein product [Timema monikensis]